jgi:hypothetical protein
MNLPWMLLAWRTLRRLPQAGNVAWVLLAFGLWNGLQFAALAYGRAHGIEASRYLDIVVFSVALNGLCLFTLSGKRRLIQLVWMGIVVAGLYRQSHTAWWGARHRLDTALQEESNVKSFLATGHFLPGANGKDLSLPYPDAERLSHWLSDPTVRRILPSNLQAAVPREEARTADRHQRLGGLRDALLWSGPYLAATGVLFLLALVAGAISQAARAWWSGDRERYDFR